MSSQRQPQVLDLATMRARLAEAIRNAPPVEVSCKVCEDAGVVDETRPCQACSVRTADGMPKPFERVRLADVRPLPGNRAALERAGAFASGDRDLFLTGGVGVGKSMIAAAILNEFVNASIRNAALFCRWPMVLHVLQPGALSESERRGMERDLFTAPLLVIDDLGCERDTATDFTRRMSFLTYEARGDAGVRTIITTNLSLDDLAEHQGDDRLASRIAGRADIVAVSGPDQRVAQRRQR